MVERVLEMVLGPTAAGPFVASANDPSSVHWHLCTCTDDKGLIFFFECIKSPKQTTGEFQPALLGLSGGHYNGDGRRQSIQRQRSRDGERTDVSRGRARERDGPNWRHTKQH